jgi:phosphohistidine phosphatase
MKTIIVCRHAKSSWDVIGMKDFDRTLNDRGNKDAPMMGMRLQQRQLKIDTILSSTANRAAQTAQHLAAAILLDGNKMQYKSSLYHASADSITNHILCIDNAVDTAIIVCHNPGITHWANEQTGFLMDNMPTCGMIAFTINTSDWTSFESAKKKLLFFDYPKK